MLGEDAAEPVGHEVERLGPAGLAEVRQHLVVGHQAAGLAPSAGPARLPVGLVVLAAYVHRQRALGVGGVDADQRHRQPLRRGGVVPAVAALDAQPALRPRLVPALGESDGAALAVDVVGQRAPDTAVGADALDRVELGAGPDGHIVDRLVGERAGGAGGDTLAAGHARRRAHRVVEVEGDARRVTLAAAADHVVALDVVAGADAAVAEDAGVVVDGDHRVGQVGTAPVGSRQVTGQHVVAVGQVEQQVVAGRGLLRVGLGCRLVDDQQLGQGRPALFELRGRRGDLHALLAGAYARRRVRAASRVDHAHPAHAHRVVALVVAQHRYVDAGVLGGRPDGRALGDIELTTIDGQRDRVDLRRPIRGHSHAINPLRRLASLSSTGCHSAGGGTGRPSLSSPRAA